MAPMEVDKQDKNKKTKRKERDDNDDDDSDSGSGTDTEMLDVSFDFYDPQPHDYHSIKLLISQLLSHDASLLDLGGITDIVLEQKLVGSTVKTDGNQGDPYAVLTVLNLNVHKDNPSIAALLTYLLAATATSTPLHSLLTSLLASSASSSTSAQPNHLGLVLSERLVNMPPQVVPPMYKMLGEELQWARDDGEPYHFSHLLFLSRVFLSSASSFDEDPNAALNAEMDEAGKKKKKGGAAKKRKSDHAKVEDEVWMYHPEDEYLARHALHTHVFPFKSTPTRSSDPEADAFGVETKGQLMIIDWNTFEKDVLGNGVKGMEDFLGGTLE